MPNVAPIGGMVDSGQINQVAGKSNLGKDDFLNLLVKQLQYQDPMEPMKDTDFVAQLASFSSLEQLSNIGTSLDNSTQLNYILSQTIANTIATTLIGKEVVANSNQIHHDSNSTNRLDFNLDDAAANAEIEVKDSNGTVIRTITSNNLEKGSNSVEWDGRDNNGVRVAAGNYTFSVSAKDQDGNEVGAQTRLIGLVESVRYEDGQGYLIVNGQKISLSDIVEVNLNGSSSSGMTESGGNSDGNN